MDRQARKGDTVLFERRVMTGRKQTMPWWLGGGGVKTTENKIQGWRNQWKISFVQKKGNEGKLLFCDCYLAQYGDH
jgi:hypothetical protein